MLHLLKSGPENRYETITAAGTPDPAALIRDYDILDTPPEPAFDGITALAADLFGAPIAIIGFFDRDRVWFKSHHGLAATGISWGSGRSASAMELRIRREFDVSFFVGVPLRTPDGHDLGTLSVIDSKPRDAGPRQIRQLKMLAAIVVDLLEQRLAKLQALARANLMSSEVDHRVMNSLQFVASLLHLQSRSVGPEAAHQLTIAANRVLAVARVHRNFSADETADRVPVLAYLRRLSGELSAILGVAMTIDGAEATVPMAQIMPIGLIVNELATNAKKHGDGAIEVTFLSRPKGEYELRVADRGPGLPKTFSLDRPMGKGLGIRVVGALADQLHGRLSAGPGPTGRGARFTVVFPAA
jgi:two-component sensor histidine kinase